MAKTHELVLGGTFTVGGTIRFQVKEVEEDRAGAYFSTTINGITITGKADTMAYNLPADMQVQVKVSYVDAGGNPATVDGPVEWESSNEDIATVDAETGDSQIATIRPVSVGSVQISVRADADLGEGSRELVSTMDLTVIAGEAFAGVIEPVGPPSPIS